MYISFSVHVLVHSYLSLLIAIHRRDILSMLHTHCTHTCKIIVRGVIVFHCRVILVSRVNKDKIHICSKGPHGGSCVTSRADNYIYISKAITISRV